MKRKFERVPDNEINYISQDIFAKLLATENIQVYHKEISTAAFDLKARTLYLPIYKDITQSMYYLFVGHECSHALHTPGSEYIKKCEEKKKEYPYYHSILNILEDARIEKIMQKKFSGLPKFFAAGYVDLWNKDFFKIKEENKNIDELNLIDRINLYFKAGQYRLVKVNFSSEEMKYVKRLNDAKTFKEICELADELAERVKSEIETSQSELQYTLSELTPEEAEALKNGDYKTLKELGFSDEEIEKIKKILKNKSKHDCIGKTDKDFRDNLEKYSHSKEEKYKENNKSIVYGTLFSDEKFNKYLKSSIIDYKKVHADINDHYNQYRTNKSVAPILEKEFRNKNNHLLMYLIKQFEMKKSAEEYSKILIDNTGNINPNKLYSYKFNDDIFLNKDILPEGKNHGLVMFIDCSGSMHGVYANMLMQMLLLVLFCKKLNIPFEVYGYSNNDSYEEKFQRQLKMNALNSEQTDSIVLSKIVLKNYFSSRMKYLEFDNACNNIFKIIEHYSDLSTGAKIPYSEVLSGTPLNSAILLGSKIVKDFKDKYKLEKVSSILLSDGFDEADNNIDYNGADAQYRRYVGISSRCNNKRILVDPYTHKQYKENTNISKNIFEYFRDKSGSDLIWFYLTNNCIENMLQKYILPCSDIKNSKEAIDWAVKEYNKNQSCVIEDIFGVNELYIINSSLMSLKNIDFTDTEKVSNSIQAATKNKIFLDKFIEKIS